jgi:hypothetical protein
MNELPLVVGIPLAGMALTGFVVWIVVAAWKHRTETRAAAEFNSKLLDRISSFKDFSEFAQSEQGAKMIRGLPAELRSAGPRDRILRAVSSGAVVTTVGAGLLVMAMLMGSNHTFFIGGVTLSLGLGLLISGGVSYVLAKSLGVIEPPEHPGRLD